MTQDIVQTGAVVLRSRAAEVTPEQLKSPEFQALVQRMVKSMREAPGVGLAALYTIGFEAGLAYANAHPQYASAPTASSAPTECAAFMEKAWMRKPVPAEIDKCVALATTGVAKEPDAHRKWAYVFAMVVSSSPFLTY
jgi:hypothetical protein